MPTLAEIANQINTTLSQISTNTQDTATTAGLIKGDTVDIKLRLDTMQSTLVAGFTLVGQGIFACLEQLRAANSLLDLNAAQNETIICWLSKIAELECQQLRVLQSTQLVTKQIAADTRKIKQITEHVHPAETLAVDHENQLQAQIDACCTTPPKEPGPCFEPCRQRAVEIYKPKFEWQPPKTDAGGIQ